MQSHGRGRIVHNLRAEDRIGSVNDVGIVDSDGGLRAIALRRIEAGRGHGGVEGRVENASAILADGDEVRADKGGAGNIQFPSAPRLVSEKQVFVRQSKIRASRDTEIAVSFQTHRDRTRGAERGIGILQVERAGLPASDPMTNPFLSLTVTLLPLRAVKVPFPPMPTAKARAAVNCAPLVKVTLPVAFELVPIETPPEAPTLMSVPWPSAVKVPLE